MIRIEFFGDEIERIIEFDVVIGEVIGWRNYVVIFLVFYYVIIVEKLKRVIKSIEEEFE